MLELLMRPRLLDLLIALLFARLYTCFFLPPFRLLRRARFALVPPPVAAARLFLLRLPEPV